MNQTPWNISFRRVLVGDKLTAWHNLVSKIVPYHLSVGRDNFTWNLHRNDNFTGKSMYQYLINQDTPFNCKFIWKLKSPLKAVFRGAYWLRFWSLLQRRDTKETVRLASKALEVVALDIFAKNVWRSNNRLCF
uniref:Reverse transcriptase zinc-binding domain-containing protein n=1 Tax=Setaria viridis TaxID=4556 RepID=A0A4U6SZ01_SETVI|nr:hypothetical protein SEVIR_9G283600v2 [Setaria viridis]